MSKLGKTIFFVTVLTSLTLVVFPVAAQITKVNSSDCTTFGIKCDGNEDTKTLVTRISDIVNGFLILVGIIAVVYLVLGGVRYILSEGDEKKAESAKNTIVFALLGLIVIGLSAAIVNFVIYTVTGKSDQGSPGGSSTQQFNVIPRQ